MNSLFTEMIYGYKCVCMYIFLQANELGKQRGQLEVSGRIQTSSPEEDEDAEDMWLDQDSSYVASGRTTSRSKAG
jgi:hypothetical protein